MKSKWLAGLAALVLLSPLVLADSSPDPSSSRGQQAKDLSTLDLESLLNIKVTTASKFSENLSDAPGLMEVITKDDLQRFGGMTLAEILDRVPGLALSTASFTDRSIIASQGDQTKINSGHILFLINGRPTREVLEGGITSDLLESFPVNILEKIEVIKGPGSVLYGSNAFSGVVNLITQKADGSSVTVTGMGQGGAAATSGQVMLQHGNFSLVGAGQFHQNPSWSTTVAGTLFGTQAVIIPDHSEGAFLGINYRGLSFESSYTQWNTFYNEGAVGGARWRRGFADLGYSLKPSSRWDMNFNVTYTRTTLDAQDSIPFITRDSYEALFEWSNVVTLTAKDKLTFGALYDHIEGQELFYATNPASVISSGSRPGKAFYGQLEHQLLENVSLIGGFQGNQIGPLSLSVVPRGGIIWKPAPHYTLKALYSSAFRAPSINENFIHYIPPVYIGGPSLTGSPDLLPEKVATIDIGLTYQNDRFLAGVDYFHSRQTESIIELNPATTGQYVNLGSANFQGGEVEGRYYFRQNFFAMSSALLQFNKDSSGNMNITPIANYGFKAGVSYEKAGGLTLAIFDDHQGPVHGYDLSLNPKPGSYDMLNANIRYDLSKYLPVNSKMKLALVGHGTNLLNREIWLPDWKDAPGQSIFYNRGRTVYFGIEVSRKME